MFIEFKEEQVNQGLRLYLAKISGVSVDKIHNARTNLKELVSGTFTDAHFGDERLYLPIYGEINGLSVKEITDDAAFIFELVKIYLMEEVGFSEDLEIEEIIPSEKEGILFSVNVLLQKAL